MYNQRADCLVDQQGDLNKIKFVENEADKARSLVHGLEYQLQGIFKNEDVMKN